MKTKHEDAVKDIMLRRVPPSSPGEFPFAAAGVMIYGAGNCGRDVLDVLTSHAVPVRCFLDSKVPAGTVVKGLTVLHPDDEAIPAEERGRICVVVAIFNRDTEIPPITGYLKGLGYGDIVTFPELHRYFHEDLGDRFWLTSTGFYDSKDSLLSEGLSVWDDEESRDIYKAVLGFRFTGDYGVLPGPSAEKQYFDGGLPRWKEPMSFIDCGSFDGDTLLDLRDAYGTVEMVAAFEPDPVNFGKLNKLVGSADPPFAERVVLYPCGVWSGHERLGFSSLGDSSSGLESAGETVVQCVSLDETLHGVCPTMIKMDIEGAEYEAVLGARRMIHRDLPGLAVCVYHRPDDLWRIPLLVKGWELGYKFHLRMYKHAGFELVMYAVRG